MNACTRVRRALHGCHFVRTPFDHQMLRIPRHIVPLSHTLAVTTATSPAAAYDKATATLTTTSGNGNDVTTTEAQCAQLAALCRVYKEQLVEAQSVCHYYRARYKSGAAHRRRDAERWRTSSDAQLHQWARGRCVRVHAPLCSPRSYVSDCTLGALRMLRRAPARLARDVCFVSHASLCASEQQQKLRALLQQHKAAAEHNRRSRDTTRSTYDEGACVYFAQQQLAVLPPTTGVHRADVRARLCGTSSSSSSSDHDDCGSRSDGSNNSRDDDSSLAAAAAGVLPQLRAALLSPWRAAAERTALVLGCNSVPYLRRQLQHDAQYSLLVVDRALDALAHASAALVPVYGARVSFLRCDAMFTLLSVLEPAMVDLVVVPMPAPVWSAKSSHRRLVTSELFCAAHRTLRVRASVDDARGIVVFSDCEPYAAFMLDQLEQSKLMVPWRRKHATPLYARWLPLTATPATTAATANMRRADDAARVAGAESDAVAMHEFAKQRTRHVVCFAASKSAEATTQAMQLIESYDYKRRYWPALAQAAA